MSERHGPAKIAIKDIAYYLPERVVSNDQLSSERPKWDMRRVENRVGVQSRHIAEPAETALDLAVVACLELLERNSELKDLVDGVIFCTQSPDFIMPPNACLLHRELDLKEDVFAVDTNLACSGYVYSLALAQGLIAAGTCTNILLVTSDTYSKFIHPDDRSTRTLFGDAAAVSWICASDDGTGVVDLLCQTSGRGYETFYIPAGGARHPKTADTSLGTSDSSGNIRTDETIHMDGMGVLTFVAAAIPAQVRRILERNGLEVGDLDLVVFHQASKMALDTLARALAIPPERLFRNLSTIGNTVSASIPISLAQARADGRVPPGGLVLLSGFGVGLSWATALIRS
jgi:3-oxoacyl-[acyl-carrier-protein] synthase-3